MRSRLWVAMAALVLPHGWSAAQPAAASVALVGATLIDGTGAPPIPNATILIEGSRIKAVGPRRAVSVPAGTTVIDATGKYLLPGFIDLHMHLTYPANQALDALQTDAEGTLRAVYYMEMFHRLGITSVRDVAAPVEPIKAAAAALGAGLESAVRVFGVGRLITSTGGHGGRLRAAVQVDGPVAFRQAVRTNHSHGFRHIKLSPPYTLEEVQAAVDEARTRGMRITSHGGGRSDTWPTSMTKIAVMGGVQSIEHLNQMDDDALDLIAAKGVAIIPTIAIYRHLYRENLIAREMIEVRGWKREMHETLLRKAHQRGILLGVGSDAVGGMMKLYPDLYFEEMRYFVELGMTPMEAIVAATKNGGIIIGDQYGIGTLEPGKLADLQILATDPLASFAGLGKPELVMIGGRIRRYQ
ncbi:MAG: amidohydrolase family protein [Gemmatimonadetes bacterium]|nr:amidohydrolase family protein [Gemmatimonadota bacterium]